MRATIKQIAEQSGLSVPTVSRILSNKGEAHQAATRERVLQVAQSLGYRPNSSARAMRRGRFDNIALLQSGTEPYRSLLPLSLLNGILDAAGTQELRLSIAALPDTVLTDRQYMPMILREWSADGLLINYHAEIPGEMIGLVREHEIPAVWINSQQPADCVYPDDFGAGYTATRHLLGLGHTRVAFANFRPTSHYSLTDRMRGYEKAMHEAGLPSRLLTEDPISDGFTWAEAAWLSDEIRPTGFVTYTTQATQTLILAAAIRGIAIPEQLSVIGVALNSLEPFGLLSPVDTMALPEYELGQYAVAMLVRKMANPTEPLAPLAVPLTMEVGWTTAPPPG